VTEVVPTSSDGRALTKRGAATRRRLLDAAEQCFADAGFHEASVVRITEAAGVGQGTFYLYFESKRAIFEELVRDLNRRVRHAMKEASSKGSNRLEAEVLGFAAYFKFTSEHNALYRIIRQAEFVAPEMLKYHYEKLAEGYVEGLEEAKQRGEVGAIDPEVVAWALMGAGELLGMRWVLWDGRSVLPKHVAAELERFVGAVLSTGLP
jgi:AcrR family transcriptional regulator